MLGNGFVDKKLELTKAKVKTLSSILLVVSQVLAKGERGVIDISDTIY